MKRIWKISDVARLRELLCVNPRLSSSPYPKTSTPFCFTITRSPIHPPSASEVSGPTRTKLSIVFAGNSLSRRDDMIANVSVLRDELLKYRGDSDKVYGLLDDKGLRWFKSFHCGDAVVELLRQLHSWPSLALKVFNWRRKKTARGISMTSEEYAKGIMLSGRVKNINLAAEFFKEAAKKQLITTSTYNAMMGAYVWNGQTESCKSLFEVFKQDRSCSPSVATYNILISNYGRLMMVDRMEAFFREIKVLKMKPNLSTYNNLIAGYVNAWMWDKMEATFQMMRAGPVKPDINTHLLMLRGYANSLNLVQMETIYTIVKKFVDSKERQLIEAMICAYCRSSEKNRVRKIEKLLKLLPGKTYWPSLNVLLIKVYAQEDDLEGMESLINKALEHKTHLLSTEAMRLIVASYFRCKAVDKLADFINRAQSAGWRVCRSVYHGMMIMYASRKGLKEMESVLCDMESFNIPRIKKTLCILYFTYSSHGEKYKADHVAGMMLKRGYGFPRPCDNTTGFSEFL